MIRVVAKKSIWDNQQGRILSTLQTPLLGTPTNEILLMRRRFPLMQQPSRIVYSRPPPMPTVPQKKRKSTFTSNQTTTKQKSGTQSSRPVNILFRNYTSRTVSIYYVDFLSKAHLYYQLLPHHEQPQRTYSGHKWIVQDSFTAQVLRKLTVNVDPADPPTNPRIVPIYDKDQIAPETFHNEHQGIVRAQRPRTSPQKTHRDSDPSSAQPTVKRPRTFAPQRGAQTSTSTRRGQSAVKRKTVPLTTSQAPPSARRLASNDTLFLHQPNAFIPIEISPLQSLTERLKEDNTMFVDPDFRPVKKSVGTSASHSGWRRLSEIFPNCRLFPDDTTDNNSANEQEDTLDEEGSSHRISSPIRSSHDQPSSDIIEQQSILAPQQEDSLSSREVLPDEHTCEHAKNTDELNDKQQDSVSQNPLIGSASYYDLRDLVQGHFSLSWLAGALCSIGSSHMSHLQSIVHGDPALGVYQVTLHHHGKRVVIILDDYVPVDAAGVPSFTRPVEHTIIWPCIVEKTFAKLLGSYSALCSSNGSHRALHEFNSSSVLAALLGGKARWMHWGKHDQTGKETEKIINDHFLWSTLLKKNRVLILTPKPVCGFGLVPFHGYQVLDVMHIERMKGTGRKELNLFLVRTSFGRSTWHGAWSQQDKMWNKFPEVRENLYLEDDCDGSLFWMELKDVLKEFETVWFN